MLSKITSALKSGQFWAGFAVGALAATAIPSVRNLAAKIAAKIPGAKVTA